MLLQSTIFGAIFVIFPKVFAQNEDIFCSTKFCEKYKQDNKCPNLPDNCKIQNSTHNGLILPFPGPCNCCDYCLENINRDENCGVGNPSSPTPTSICGSGLACDEDKGPSCQTIKTPCTKAQEIYDKKYENGQVGHLEVRPKCDRNGLYEPFVCIPGEICYCVSEDGERIFGEIPYMNPLNILSQCKCSRNYHSATKFLGVQLHASEHMRCKSNGDYDKVQCIGNACLCVDERDGSPAFKDTVLVNMTDINNETLPCLKNESYTEGYYYKECENLYVDELKEMKLYEEQGFEVASVFFQNCQLDGNYASIQKKDKKKFCSYPNGTLLEDYIIDDDDSDLAKTMDCKCARARSLIKSNEKPECCKNGNYKAMQCRRGLCRCVDSNGTQIVKEVDYADREKLPCFNSCTPNTIVQ